MTGFNFAWELFEPNLRLRPDKTAYICGGLSVTFRELYAKSVGFASMLDEAGVVGGERVLIVLPDCISFVVTFLGSVFHGAVPVPGSVYQKKKHYDYLLQDSGASVMVFDEASEAVDAVSPGLRLRIPVIDDSLAIHGADGCVTSFSPAITAADDMAFMLYSSGSTGNPKGVPHTHRDPLFCADHYAANILRMSETDMVFSAAKAFHAYGLGNSVFFPLRFGAAAIFNPERNAAGLVIDMVTEHKPTLFFAVPSLYASMLARLEPGVRIDSPRLCVSAGEPMPAAVLNMWKNVTGLDILDGIGSTEALHIFISNAPGRIRPGSTGYIVPGYDAKIVDKEGNELPSETPGDLIITGGSLAREYWRRPDKTAETMLENGWIKTGDTYVKSDDGCFTYLGRSDDMLKIGANWVSPLTVENALLEHPAVSECALVGRQSAGLTVAVAYVVLKPGYGNIPAIAGRIRTHVLELLPDYMCPAMILLRDELPKTESGKISRKMLRDED